MGSIDPHSGVINVGFPRVGVQLVNTRELVIGISLVGMWILFAGFNSEGHY